MALKKLQHQNVSGLPQDVLVLKKDSCHEIANLLVGLIAAIQKFLLIKNELK